jgi:hypothetical protein
MPLIAERSLWDWAEKIAREQNESLARVLAELVTAVDRAELPAEIWRAPNEQWRLLLPSIAETVRMHTTIAGERLPPHEGIWTLSHRIMVRASDVENWLSIRLTSLVPAGVVPEAGLSDDLTKARKGTLASDVKTPIPAQRLRKYLEDIRANGGPIPAADKLFPEVVVAFPQHRITRQDVRTVHREVWGELSPGRRKSAK